MYTWGTIARISKRVMSCLKTSDGSFLEVPTFLNFPRRLKGNYTINKKAFQ